MACLNLDTPGDACLLCKYTDQEYLTNLFESLCGSTSAANVYHTMFQLFAERQKLLERQRLPFLKLEFSAFKHHFEHHVLSLRKVLYDDVDTVKHMKETVVCTRTFERHHVLNMLHYHEGLSVTSLILTYLAGRPLTEHVTMLTKRDGVFHVGQGVSHGLGVAVRLGYDEEGQSHR